jgi:indole-3-pyruvate monooxygenase
VTGAPVREVDTIVVGASAAGLATAACLQRAGVDCEVVEQAEHVGATWRGHYDRLHLHTSRGLSGLPHFSFPRRFPRYPSRDQVVEYLEAYAAHFNLQPHFGQRITAIVRDRPQAAWLTRSETAVWRSRHVVIATGNTRVLHRPRWSGETSFGNVILHSAQYRNGKAFAGKRVLVVGIGNSGAEIALDLLEHGARPSIAVRSPVNIVPRDLLGLPIVASAIVLSLLPAAIGDVVAAAAQRLRFGRIEDLGLRKLPFGPATQTSTLGRTPIIDVGTMARIRRGDITVVASPESFSPGHVHLMDGSRHAFDAVVLATGYRPALEEFFADADGDLGDRFRLAEASGGELSPGVFLCGYRVTTTGMLREIARDARKIARDIASR